MQGFLETTLLDPLRALGQKVLAFLPNVLAMITILFAGWLMALGAGVLLERILRVIGLDRLCNRIGITTMLLRGGIKTDPSRLAGRTLYGILFVMAAIGGLGALDLDPLNRFAHSSLAYLPHVFTSAMILIAGYVLSNFVSQAALIAAVNAGFPAARLAAGVARGGVYLVAVAMALEQLGIARNIVVVGFGITLGGGVLAAAIAFGLGARDLAKTFLERRLSGPASERPDDLRHL